MSLWEDSWASRQSKPSFAEPVADPGTDPGSAPFVCVRFNQEWLPLVLGSLLQLCQPPSWTITDPALLDDVLGRATKLLNLFGEAGACPVQEDGLVTLTILTGNPDVTTAITFVETYAVVPKVDVSCDNPDLIASWHDVTLTGCTITITAATPVATDTIGAVSWSTNP